MSTKILILFLSLVSVSLAQRPGYAGSLPYGYPVIITTTTSTASTPAASTNNLGNRFGEDIIPTTQAPPRLPLEANGDQQLINFLSSLPKDQQPFWFLNWQAIEDDRRQPHTYPIRDNGYLDFSAPSSQQVQLQPRSGQDQVDEVLPPRSMYLS